MESDKADFITLAEYNGLEKAEMKHYVRYAPSAETDGFYRIGFLGKINNPAVNWEGYLPTGNYFLYQLMCVLNFGSTMVSNLLPGVDFSVISVILLVIGYILGILIRLPIAILLTVIQFIVVLFSSKQAIS